MLTIGRGNVNRTPCSMLSWVRATCSATGGNSLVCVPLESSVGGAEVAVFFITVRELFESLEWHEGINLRRSHSAEG